MKRKTKKKPLKNRNPYAVEGQHQTGAGEHGKTGKHKHRADRKKNKQKLKNKNWED